MSSRSLRWRRVALLGAVAAGCARPQPPELGSTQRSLRTIFEGAFLVGAALNAAQFSGLDPIGAAIVQAQFNSITPENVLKWGSVHPRPGTYDFAAADRYGGRIKGWDVVNEAIKDDGTLRRTPWLTTLGEDYVATAFRFAHEADPDAELYYNDYSLENAPKRRGAVELVQRLQDEGIPIAAVGLQNHDRLDWPSPAQEDSTIDGFAALGVRVMITELDVDVLPRGADPFVDGLPDSLQQALARRYAELFGSYLRHRGTVTRVTFWGVTDRDSWLNNWPVRGRTNYPLLFDRDGRPKPAFAAVIGTAPAKQGRHD